MHTKCFTLHTVAMCSLFSGGQALHIPCTDTGSPEWGSDAVNKFVKVRRTEKNNSNKQMQNRTDQTSNIQGETKAITFSGEHQSLHSIHSSVLCRFLNIQCTDFLQSDASHIKDKTELESNENMKGKEKLIVKKGK